LNRLVLAAALALALHALLLSTRVKWTGETLLSPPPPIRLSLSYRSPEPEPAAPPPIIESHPKAPTSPAPKGVKEPKRLPVSEKKDPLPKKRPVRTAKEPKPLPESPAADKDMEPKPATEEKTETTAPMERPPSIPPGSAKAMTPHPPHGLPSSPESGNDKVQAPSRLAVPLYLRNPPPEYPPAARRRGYEGTVVLEVLVDRKGKVRDQRLFESSGHDLLDRAAMRSVKGWEFEPARHGEEAVEMWVKVPLTFRLKNQNRN
jgi:periplasmic protein TonB